jgi:hypothetical protein
VEVHRLELTDDEYKGLSSDYPENGASNLIGKRAEEIVKIYFRKKDAQCKFARPQKGADLHVVLSGKAPMDIEVKGTKSADVAWQQLKVSSQHSRDLLETGVPVYRVTGVFQQSPSIYVLMYGRDFTLEREPRWTFRRVEATGLATK